MWGRRRRLTAAFGFVLRRLFIDELGKDDYTEVRLPAEITSYTANFLAKGHIYRFQGRRGRSNHLQGQSDGSPIALRSPSAPSPPPSCHTSGQ